MDDDGNYRAGPRLSSFDGLRDAAILNWIAFDPVDGLISVRYAPAYDRILRAGFTELGDPRFVAAVLRDDPVAMGGWIETTTARLDDEHGIDRRPPRKRRRDRQTSR